MGEASTRKTPRRAAVKKAGRKKAEAAEQPIADSGDAGKKVSPLDFMLKLMRDEAKPAALRLSAARAAAPYVHGRYAGEEPEGESRLRESLAALIEQAQKQGGGVAALVKRH